MRVHLTRTSPVALAAVLIMSCVGLSDGSGCLLFVIFLYLSASTAHGRSTDSYYRSCIGIFSCGGVCLTTRYVIFNFVRPSTGVFVVCLSTQFFWMLYRSGSCTVPVLYYIFAIYSCLFLIVRLEPLSTQFHSKSFVGGAVYENTLPTAP